MEKEFGQTHTVTYGGATLGGVDLNTDPEEKLQVWKFTQKPTKIVVRPDSYKSVTKEDLEHPVEVHFTRQAFHRCQKLQRYKS